MCLSTSQFLLHCFETIFFYVQTQISESESSESLPSKGKLLLYDPVKVYKDVKDMDFMAFKYRFPKAHWHNALKFFCQDI